MAELVLRYALYLGRILFDLAKFGILDYEWREPFDQVNESAWILQFIQILFFSTLFIPYMALAIPPILYLHFKLTYYRLLKTKLQPERHNDTDVPSITTPNHPTI